ncbi:hypothetical protein GX51_00438 [Blastomyces parvus]|uniref:Uncharacterized protein n=1 Tax=Blastomyces parvus TaxID=2060905 RepID=A0A2B7XMD8_9EURO|nr:hypothetical protein GX51_00438 [Blastomyces parvus]
MTSRPPSPPSPLSPPSQPEPPATLTDLQHTATTLTNRLERQLLHIKDRSFNRVHRKIDALLNKIAAKEDVFREFGAVKRAVAAVSALVAERGPLLPPVTTQTDGFEAEVRRELHAVREDVACCRREVGAVRAVMVNQWVRGLSGLIVRVPPLDPACGGGGSWEDDFPATVGEFWKLGYIEKRDTLVRLAESYATHIPGWQDWRRAERDDPSLDQFTTIRDAASEYPMRCLRALAAAWGLAFDLLEQPPPVPEGDHDWLLRLLFPGPLSSP